MLLQACRSLLSIAYCMEMQNANPEMVAKCYVQAECSAARTTDIKLLVSFVCFHDF